MDVENMLAGLDQLFEEQKIEQVEGYLLTHLEQALKLEDTGAVLTILNEMVGYYREMCEYEKSILYGEKAIPILEQAGLANSIFHATTLLNLATAYRAAAENQKALSLYEQVEVIYDLHLPKQAKEYASLYNNKSLALQELLDYEKAAACQKKALDITMLYQDMEFEQAVSCANLGNSYAKLSGKEREAKEYLLRAVSIFEKRGSSGNHYGAALMGLGDLAAQKGDYQEAQNNYQKSMETILQTIGHTDFYYIVEEKYLQNQETAKKQGASLQAANDMSGMDLAKCYYKEVVLPMLDTQFPEWKEQLAIGLVGEGSDCYGFDDATSRDHDWGPSLCIWLTEEQELKIGEALRASYEKLPKQFRGYQIEMTPQAMERRGVLGIDAFYKRLLGTLDYQKLPLIQEYALAAATNGEVFQPGEGSFCAIREQLKKYYKEAYRLQRLAQSMTLFRQHLQYNYPRMLFRKDYLSASLLLTKAMEESYSIAYLLLKRYKPHEKWLVRGIADTELGTKLESFWKALWHNHGQLPEKRVTDAMCKKQFALAEQIAALLLEEMALQKLIVRKDDNDMESYAFDLAKRAHYEALNKKELVDEVVLLEWKAFDQVKNEGGRADCQDNWNTFQIMRSSQYLIWTKEMLVQYACDFQAAVEAGWNPIMEKYGRMEESTAPEAYAEIQEQLPVIPEEKKHIMEEIIKIQVDWMEHFAKAYPNMAGNARSIHTYEDTPYNTSYETYLRGELGTYTDIMLGLYGQFIVSLAKEEKNLAYLIMEQTALLYGYHSLEDAERALQ